jgi:MFS-type transporter involved in bile tolerance (Atg22 family)
MVVEAFARYGLAPGKSFKVSPLVESTKAHGAAARYASPICSAIEIMFACPEIRTILAQLLQAAC